VERELEIESEILRERQTNTVKQRERERERGERVKEGGREWRSKRDGGSYREEEKQRKRVRV